jgi:DNA-directed RNA polymerase subunit delta
MEKRRIIVDYKNITSEQLSLITDRYPEGFAPEDMISFKNSKGETVRAVPLETSDTKYLFKVSIEMERRMEAFMDEEDESEASSDDDAAPDEDVAEDLDD